MSTAGKIAISLFVAAGATFGIWWFFFRKKTEQPGVVGAQYQVNAPTAPGANNSIVGQVTSALSAASSLTSQVRQAANNTIATSPAAAKPGGVSAQQVTSALVTTGAIAGCTAYTGAAPICGLAGSVAAPVIDKGVAALFKGVSATGGGISSAAGAVGNVASSIGSAIGSAASSLKFW